MRDSIYRINLDVHTAEAQVQLTAKRGDSARRICATLMEDGKPWAHPLDGRARAVMTVTTPDNGTLVSDCDLRADGTVIFDFTELTVKSDGVNECELKVFDDDGAVLTSPRFTILVTENVFDEGALSKSKAIEELKTAVEALQAAQAEDDETEKSMQEAIEKAAADAADARDVYLVTAQYQFESDYIITVDKDPSEWVLDGSKRFVLRLTDGNRTVDLSMQAGSKTVHDCWMLFGIRPKAESGGMQYLVQNDTDPQPDYLYVPMGIDNTAHDATNCMYTKNLENGKFLWISKPHVTASLSGLAEDGQITPADEDVYAFLPLSQAVIEATAGQDPDYTNIHNLPVHTVSYVSTSWFSSGTTGLPEGYYYLCTTGRKASGYGAQIALAPYSYRLYISTWTANAQVPGGGSYGSWVSFTDTSMTKEGVPADAKTVGEMLKAALTFKGALGSQTTPDAPYDIYDVDETSIYYLPASPSSGTGYYYEHIPSFINNRTEGCYLVTVITRAQMRLRMLIAANGVIGVQTVSSQGTVSDWTQIARMEDLLSAIDDVKNEIDGSIESGSFIDDAYGEVRPRWRQGDVFSEGVPGKTIRTDFLKIKNKVLHFELADGYKLIVVKKTEGDGATAEKNTFLASTFIYACSNALWAFEIQRTESGTTVSPGDAEAALSITKIDPEKRETIGHGIFSVPLKWVTGITVSNTYQQYSPSGTIAVSQPIKIPKSGLRIVKNPKFNNRKDGQLPLFGFATKKLTDYGFSDPEDEDLIAINNSPSMLSDSIFIPHEDETYAILKMYNRSTESPAPDPAIDLSELSDFLIVYGGQVEDTGGKPMNLFPVRIITNNGPDNDLPTSFDVSNYSSAAMYSSMRYYAMFVRLGDVRRVISGPQSELMAEIWKRQANGYEKYDTVWGREPFKSGSATNKSAGKVGGVPVIDLSNYDFDGYAIICFRGKLQVYSYKNAGSDTQRWGVRNLGMGMLRGYKEICDGVYVEYMPSCAIEVEGGMPLKLAENIRVFENFLIPYTYAGTNYSLYNSKTKRIFPEMYDVSPAFYIGGAHANSPFMNLRTESYVTAAKNRNSRFYQFSRGGANDYGRIGYGLNCTNLVSALHGMKEASGLCGLAFLDNEKWISVSREWDYKKDWDLVKPGDAIIQIHFSGTGNSTSAASHVILVTDKVYRNGSLVCVIAIEGYPPFARQHCYYDTDYFKEIIDSEESSDDHYLLSFSPMSSLGTYHYVVRAKPEAIGNFALTFDTETNYDTGTVMCDRGKRSVYCLGSSQIMLSVSDTDATVLYLKREDDPAIAIDLGEADTINGMRVVNVANSVVTPGLYTVKTDVSDVVQEIFFVPAAEEEYTNPRCDADGTLNPDGEYMRVTIPGLSRLRYFEERVTYFIDGENTEITGKITHLPVELLEVEGDKGVIILPRQRYLRDSLSAKYASIMSCYDAMKDGVFYGTYWTGVYKSRYVQSAEMYPDA